MISALKSLKLHRFYTTDPTELELTRMEKSNRRWENCGEVLLHPSMMKELSGFYNMDKNKAELTCGDGFVLIIG